MVSFVLVHSPLVGPFTWSAVAGAMSRRGIECVVPSLTDTTAPYYQNHLARIEASARSLETPVVVVGHSGAGPLLPLALDGKVERARAYIYVDASLPTGGASRMDRMPEQFREQLFGRTRDGQIPPWGDDWPEHLWGRLIPEPATRLAFRSELRPTPLALYLEPIPEPAVQTGTSAYLQFSDAYDSEAEHAGSVGWPVKRLKGEHLHMLVAPDNVADMLLIMANELLAAW